MVSVPMDNSSDMGDTTQVAGFLHGIDIEFNITEQLAALTLYPVEPFLGNDRKQTGSRGNS
jgi:hypothetical protein